MRHFTQLSNHFIVVIAVCFYLSFCLFAGFGAVSEGSVSLGWYLSANCIIRRLNPGFVYLLIYFCMVTYVAFLFCTQACYLQNPELTHCLATKSIWCSGLSCGCLMRGSLFKPWKGWKKPWPVSEAVWHSGYWHGWAIGGSLVQIPIGQSKKDKKKGEKKRDKKKG